MSEWAKGEIVFVNNGTLGGGMLRQRVARVLKTFVELEDGSKWSHTGAVYPYQQYCASQTP